MLNVSDDFKIAMKQPVKELSAFIKNDDDNIIITDANDLISFKISCESELCKTAMKKIEIKCYGDYNLLGNWFKAGFGVKLSNNQYEYLDYGSFLIDKVTVSKDTGITTATGYDKMVNSMIIYKEQVINYPLTIYNYAQKMCEQCNLQLYNESFSANNNFLIYGDLYKNINGITYRDIFVQIAEATGTTCIIRDDKVYFKPLTVTNEKLTYYNMKKLSLEEKYGEINRIVLARTPAEDNIYYPKNIEETEINEFKIENNEIIDKRREEAIVPIYNALNGINFYPFETTTEGLGWYEIADSLDIENENGDVYNTSLFNFSITIDGGINEVLKSTAKTRTQTQYQYATSINKKITNTEIIVDKQKQQITELVEESSDTQQKVSKVIQTVDELNSKISDIADITIMSESTYGKVNFTNINASEPIYISIHPILDNISYLYPRNNLYPNDDLFMRTRILRFTNTSTKEIFEYKLPDNLLWCNGTYDEFILSYDSQICKVIKKCGYNADGTTYVLDNEQIVEYEYPTINLTDGDYEIELVGYDNAYIMCRLMAQNIYTTQFATKAEVNSEIKQTTQEIGLSVDSKLSNYSTTAEMNSAISIKANEINSVVSNKVGKNEVVSTINQSAEAIRLTAGKLIFDSNNFKLKENGEIIATGGKIGGFNLSENQFSTNINDTYKFDVTDINTVLAYSLGYISLPSEMISLYDADNNNTINLLDVVRLINTMNGSYNYKPEIKGSVEINPLNVKESFVVKNNNNTLKTIISLFSIFSNVIRANSFIAGNQVGTNFSGVTIDSEKKMITVTDGTNTAKITPTLIQAQTVSQTSLAEKKKNIEMFENALKEVLNTDIYSYNFINQKDDDKKHIGFIIGKKYKYSKYITSIDEEEKEIGVDVYSMVSVLWEAVKEQQKQINKLEDQIKEMEEKINGKNSI